MSPTKLPSMSCRDDELSVKPSNRAILEHVPRCASYKRLRLGGSGRTIANTPAPPAAPRHRRRPPPGPACQPTPQLPRFWGVMQRCPLNGMRHRPCAPRRCATRGAPRISTASQPAAQTRRRSESRSRRDGWYDQNGRSPITNAAGAARVTARMNSTFRPAPSGSVLGKTEHRHRRRVTDQNHVPAARSANVARGMCRPVTNTALSLRAFNPARVATVTLRT